MNEPIVFLKTGFVPASQASLNIYDLGVVLGATLTEFTRTFAHQLFRLDDHVKRLYRSLKYANIKLPFGPDEMLARSNELIAHNTALLKPEADLGIVHFVTPGENLLYAGSAAAAGPLTPTIVIHSFPLPFAAWRHLMAEGAHVVTPSVRHIPPECLDPKTKNRSRLDWWLADQQTHTMDPKAISLLLDLRGNLTECAGSNFVIVKDRTIYTPTSRNILEGVSLVTVREIAPTLGLQWVEKDLQPYDVINADEAWLTTTPYCLAPAVKINGIPIGAGKIGPVYHEMATAWSERIGFDFRQQILAPVP